MKAVQSQDFKDIKGKKKTSDINKLAIKIETIIQCTVKYTQF